MDLNGVDVAKKILILLRENGVECEIDNIKIESLIPNSIDPNISIQDFFYELKKHEDFYNSKLKKAQMNKKVLRYIGSWNGKKASLKLQSVSSSNPFYSLEEKENILIVKSKNYKDIPIIIRGPGAGIKVTAAGVFNDLNLILK